ncbi:MAG: hypothetical protein RBT65_07385 [Methanolobus sp.]|nr:hypothetical protein [Methanolobus sp.]
MRKSREEIRNWLLENCVNENGNLDLSNLDFSDFEGDVITSCMKVKRNLWQDTQEVAGDLSQFNQKVEFNLYQYNQKVEGNLYQHTQKVKGKIYK